MWPRRTDSWRRDPRFGVLSLAGAAAAVAFVALVAAVLLAPAFLTMDMAVSTWIHDLDIVWLEAVSRAITWLGSGWVIAPATLIVGGWLFVRRSRAAAVLLAASVTSGVVAGEATKLVVARARPALEWARIPLPETFSFPSTHALASALFFGVMVFLVLSEAGSLKARFLVATASVAAVLLVGMSRIYLGVHYFVDVLGGWVLAAAVLSIAFAVYLGASPTGRAEGEA